MHREIAKGVYYIGVDDHHTVLFENLWKIPWGVSYNSYLVVGDKIALVETVKEPWTDEWLANIRELIDPEKIDYIVLNHMEPDHTGVIRTLRRVAPNVEVLCTSRAVKLLQNYYGVVDNVRTVKEGETLDLGSHELRFHITPMVHWPETMVTYETSKKVLFSCDAFGGYGALQCLYLRLLGLNVRRTLAAELVPP